MKQKLCAFLLTFAMLSASAVGASAKQIDVAPVERQRDIGIVAADYPEAGSELEPDGALPSAYSNRTFATPVRNQMFNTCWAYASTAVLEIAANKAGIYNEFLSPMHMNYWARTREDGTGWQRDHTAGGYPYIAMGYLTSYSGTVKESDFPQSASVDDYDTFGKDLPGFLGASSLIYLKAEDRNTVKTAIYEYGAAVGNFNYESQYFNFTNSSYNCDFEGLTTAQLHGQESSSRYGRRLAV